MLFWRFPSDRDHYRRAMLYIHMLEVLARQLTRYTRSGGAVWFSVALACIERGIMSNSDHHALILLKTGWSMTLLITVFCRCLSSVNCWSVR